MVVQEEAEAEEEAPAVAEDSAPQVADEVAHPVEDEAADSAARPVVDLREMDRPVDLAALAEEVPEAEAQDTGA